MDGNGWSGSRTTLDVAQRKPVCSLHFATRIRLKKAGPAGFLNLRKLPIPASVRPAPAGWPLSCLPRWVGSVFAPDSVRKEKNKCTKPLVWDGKTSQDQIERHNHPSNRTQRQLLPR